MKVALFHGGHDIRVQDLPMPEVGPGHVLVRVRAAGICGSDLHDYRGPMSSVQHPRPSGHELSGEIAAIGSGVEGLEVGLSVGVEPMHLRGCGRCASCRRGHYHVCPRRGLSDGQPLTSAGFSEYDVVAADNVFPLPASISFEEAAILDVYAVAVHALHRVPLRPPHTVAVLGDGAVGIALGQVARTLGAQSVILVGHHDLAMRVAVEAGGADTIVDAGAVDPVDAVVELTDGEGAQCVYEAVGGRGPTVQMACDMAAIGGYVGVIGGFVEPIRLVTESIHRKELDLRWVNSYSTWNGVKEIQIALDLLAAGRIHADPLITHRVPLDRICDGFALADNKRESAAIKVLVIP
jgi:threonine dehydrogenase-like Zn-dependent dehydrogenase